MSSEGAAGASAAARRRGAASRKATLQARAPEEDILADRPRDDLEAHAQDSRDDISARKQTAQMRCRINRQARLRL
jgi:hypothetical protein